MMEVKAKACDILLDYRLSKKKDTTKIENRIHVALPKKKDGTSRKPNIPDSVTQGVQRAAGPTIREMEVANGGAGVFYFPIENHYQLEKEDWRWDNWPEFFNGKNVVDFYDADIEKKLDELEKEEALLLDME